MNNNIMIVGNIGKDPELKFSQKGDAVASLNIAITPRQRNGTEWEDADPIWYKATFFGAKAEAVVDKYKRGQRVSLVGQLQKGQPWTDRGGVHREGSLEIGNPEIEHAPWEKKGAIESGALAPAEKDTVAPIQSDEAPF